MATYIKLKITKKPIPETVPDYASAYLKVEVELAQGIDPEIFVFHHEPTGPYSDGPDGDGTSYFYSIASVGEIQTLPTEVGYDMEAEGFFRARAVEFMFENNDDLEKNLAFLKDHVDRLVVANDLQIEDPGVVSTVEFGTAE